MTLLGGFLLKKEVEQQLEVRPGPRRVFLEDGQDHSKSVFLRSSQVASGAGTSEQLRGCLV